MDDHELLEVPPGSSDYVRLLAEAAVSGRCPVFVNSPDVLSSPVGPPGTASDVAARDVELFLARGWPGRCCPSCACQSPFGDEFPGLVGALEPVEDVLVTAGRLAGTMGGRRLTLVSAARPADVPTVVSWSGAVNYGVDPADLSAVLRSWEVRFGALLVGMDRATLWVSVAAPPRTERDCLGIAAEHFAFCPDVDGEDPRPLRRYAGTLWDSSTWRFWWD